MQVREPWHFANGAPKGDGAATTSTANPVFAAAKAATARPALEELHRGPHAHPRYLLRININEAPGRCSACNQTGPLVLRCSGKRGFDAAASMTQELGEDSRECRYAECEDCAGPHVCAHVILCAGRCAIITFFLPLMCVYMCLCECVSGRFCFEPGRPAEARGGGGGG